jgi:lipopolysaccharide export LptBFGC system permease protein LptF
MGWIFVIALALLAFFALYRSGRCSRLALEIGAAALLVGIAGYGWQGSPDMAGHPVQSTSR